MTKSLIAISAIFLGALPFAQATTVTFGAVPSARTVTAADGLTVVTSGLVWAGNFVSESFSFNPAISISANVAAISAAGLWEQFSVDTALNTVNATVSGGLSINGTGKVGGTFTDQSTGATKADYFNGKALYLWIFNAATPAAATQMGIFRATVATQAWTFATNLGGGVGDSLTYSTNSLATNAPTIVATAAVGLVTNGAGSIASPGSLQLVAAVPEPSTLALAGVAGMGLLTSRRRKQRK